MFREMTSQELTQLQPTTLLLFLIPALLPQVTLLRSPLDSLRKGSVLFLNILGSRSKGVGVLIKLALEFLSVPGVICIISIVLEMG